MKTKPKNQTTKRNSKAGNRRMPDPTFRVVAQLTDGTNLNASVSGSPVVLGDTGNQAVVVTDALGHSTAMGDESFAIAGLGGTANAGAGLAYVLGSANNKGGLAFCGARGVAITAEGGTADTGDGGIAAALENGNAIVQGRGVAIVKGTGAANVMGLTFEKDGASGVAIAINTTAGNFDATAAAGQGGVLVFGYINGNGKQAFSVTTVDDKTIKAGKAYKVDKTGKIIKAW